MDFLGDSDSDDGAVEQEQLLPLDDEDSRAAALQLRPAGSGVLAFHSGIEEAMLLFVERVATSGDPKSVLLAVDNYCYSRHWMMHVSRCAMFCKLMPHTNFRLYGVLCKLS